MESVFFRFAEAIALAGEIIARTFLNYFLEKDLSEAGESAESGVTA
jgi:hypothetical protein